MSLVNFGDRRVTQNRDRPVSQLRTSERSYQVSPFHAFGLSSNPHVSPSNPVKTSGYQSRYGMCLYQMAIIWL